MSQEPEEERVQGTMNCNKSIVINVIKLSSMIRTEKCLNLIIKRSLGLHF